MPMWDYSEGQQKGTNTAGFHNETRREDKMALEQVHKLG